VVLPDCGAPGAQLLPLAYGAPDVECLLERRAPDTMSQAAGDPLLRRRIAKALTQLSRSQKETFVLVHLEGFSVREAAALMEKPEAP